MQQYVIILVGEHIYTIVSHMVMQKGSFLGNDEQYGIPKRPR